MKTRAILYTLSLMTALLAFTAPAEASQPAPSAGCSSPVVISTVGGCDGGQGRPASCIEPREATDPPNCNLEECGNQPCDDMHGEDGAPGCSGEVVVTQGGCTGGEGGPGLEPGTGGTGGTGCTGRVIVSGPGTCQGGTGGGPGGAGGTGCSGDVIVTVRGCSGGQGGPGGGRGGAGCEGEVVVNVGGCTNGKDGGE